MGRFRVPGERHGLRRGIRLKSVALDIEILLGRGARIGFALWLGGLGPPIRFTAFEGLLGDRCRDKFSLQLKSAKTCVVAHPVVVMITSYEVAMKMRHNKVPMTAINLQR